MRTGRTYTAHFNLETRQHDLLGLDLGEGVPRRALVLAVVAILGWTALLIPVLGLPNRVTTTLYVLPPILFATFGMQESSRFPTRRRITDWALRVQYVLRGHRPIIRLGARAADPTEYLPIRERVSEETALTALQLVTPWRDVRAHHNAALDHLDDIGLDLAADDLDDVGASDRPLPPMARPVGRAIRMEQRAQLLGQDHVYRAYQRTFKQTTPSIPTARPDHPNRLEEDPS